MKLFRTLKNSYLKKKVLDVAPQLPKIMQTMTQQPFFFITEEFETKNPMKYYVAFHYRNRKEAKFLAKALQ